MGKQQVLAALIACLASSGVLAYLPEELAVDNPYLDDHWSDAEWGIDDHCPSGKAFAFDMRYEQPGAIDQTATNALKLYCRDDDGEFTGSVTSIEGKYGDYMGLRSCPENNKLTGFRLR